MSNSMRHGVGFNPRPWVHVAVTLSGKQLCKASAFHAITPSLERLAAISGAENFCDELAVYQRTWVCPIPSPSSPPN